MVSLRQVIDKALRRSAVIHLARSNKAMDSTATQAPPRLPTRDELHERIRHRAAEIGITFTFSTEGQSDEVQG